MKKICLTAALFVLLLFFATTAQSMAPQLIKSIPAEGAVNVSLQQGKILLFFDQNMKMDSWSLLQSGTHPFPPLIPIEEPWIDPLTFEFAIKPLTPNTTYSIQLNGKKRKGFAASEGQLPLPITTITFTTIPDTSQTTAPAAQKAQVVPTPPPTVQPSAVNKQQKSKTAKIYPGWQSKVTRSVGMEGTELYENGYQAPFRIFQKVVFTETVSRVVENTIQEVNREIISAQLHSLNPENGQMVGQDLVPPGTRFRVSHTSHGSTLFNAATGEEIWDTDMVAAFSPPVVPRLWPQGALHAGQKWSYNGAELISRIALLDVLGGEIDLQVKRIEREPSTGLSTAIIRGQLKTKVDLDDIVLDFNATVEIDLPLVLGIPFMVKFDGHLSGSGVTQDQRGQPIKYQIKAKGTLLQVAKPSKAVIESVGGEQIERVKPIDKKGAIRVPLSDNSNTHSQDAMWSGKKETAVSDGSNLSGQGAPVYRYKLYEDRTEQAFTVLVPAGWQTEGGIMRIPPNQIRTVVDKCGKKLYFSIFDPKTHASITYLPMEMYGTTAPGTSFFNPAPGQVLNGMIQMPQLLTPSQYVQQVVFPQYRRNVSNVEWGKLKSLSTLADAWKRAFHSQDRIPPLVRAESIEVAYDYSGTRFAELWTSMITSGQDKNTTIWMPPFTVIAGAPIDYIEKIAPVLKAVITSFRMNSTWMAQADAKFNQCTKGVVASHEQIRANDRRIAKRLKQVQKEIHKIDSDIVANRNKTRSVIQEHEHNTLMGLEKSEDPGTGKRYIIDMSYERNFTDGDTIIQTNDQEFSPPVGYRDMRSIHITDE